MLGRFLVTLARSVARVGVALVVFGSLACGAGPRPGEEAPAGAARAFPAVEEGPSSPSGEADASRLLSLAGRSLREGRFEDAARAAERVVSAFPTVTGTSEALWIWAQAAWELGEPEPSAEAARRFREIVPEDHGLRTPARLAEGRALEALGRARMAVEVLLPIADEAPDSLRLQALDVVRSAVTELPQADLESLAQGPALGWERLRAPILAEVALALHTRGREEAAAEAARSALSLSAEGPEAELARSVLADEVTVRRRGTALLGAVLPTTGSPGEREYAALVEEGVRARLEGELQAFDVPVELQVRDDEGSPRVAGDLIGLLTSEGAAGVVGPLSDEAVDAAARARRVPVPMISPTARSLPPDAKAVYSLRAPDPGAPRVLARYAIDRDLTEAVVVHPRSHGSTFEARAFADEFRRLGGRVLGILDYASESTFFQESLAAVRNLQPAALVLPIPAGDVELFAPQITYFGLDTLGIQVLGTADWVNPEALEAVEPRHTDGVVVATPRPPGRATEAHERFVRTYETLLQKTLRSPIPALGYDAAGLLLEAFRRGVRSPDGVREALEEIRAFQGATGTISILDGRIVRVHHLVRLRNREMIPVRVDFDVGSDPP